MMADIQDHSRQAAAWKARVLRLCRVGTAGVLALFFGAVALVLVDLLYGLRTRGGFSGDLQSIPYYASKEWTAQFMADQDRISSSKTRYKPFVIWQRPPYASATVNVDDAGRRVVPGAACGEGAIRIFFFGGSTMWGTSAPDEGTIPACFLRIADPHVTRPLCVRNYGESAWNSTQCVIALIQAIQRGEIPDLVVFYDGANDLTWTFGNDTPMRHGQYERIAEVFNSTGRGRGHAGLRVVSPVGILRLLAPNMMADRDLRRQGGTGPSDRSPAHLEALAGEAMDVHRANRRLVQAMADAYGFRCHFFWQPFLVYGRKPPAEGEKRILEVGSGWARHFGPFAAHANARVAADAGPTFTDLSSIFAKLPQQIYTDMVHITPEGNELVAQRIFEALAATLRGLDRVSTQ